MLGNGGGCDNENRRDDGSVCLSIVVVFIERCLWYWKDDDERVMAVTAMVG